MPGPVLPLSISRLAFVASEPARARVAVQYAAASDSGAGREHNEDCWAADAGSGLFALADGMGGSHAGEIASRIAVTVVASHCTTLRAAGVATADALAQACEDAHREIAARAAGNDGCLGMGTTLVAAVLEEHSFTVAHVGDSRAYLWRASRLRRLTRDHSLCQQLVDSGRLDASRALRLPARKILTRTLGIDTEAPAEVARHELRDGDLLLLCSDGLSDALDDAAIATQLDAHGADLEECVRALLTAALRRGGTDDMTVLLARTGAAALARH